MWHPTDAPCQWQHVLPKEEARLSRTNCKRRFGFKSEIFRCEFNNLKHPCLKFTCRNYWSAIRRWSKLGNQFGWSWAVYPWRSWLMNCMCFSRCTGRTATDLISHKLRAFVIYIICDAYDVIIKPKFSGRTRETPIVVLHVALVRRRLRQYETRSRKFRFAAWGWFCENRLMLCGQLRVHPAYDIADNLWRLMQCFLCRVLKRNNRTIHWKNGVWSVTCFVRANSNGPKMASIEACCYIGGGKPIK